MVDPNGLISNAGILGFFVPEIGQIFSPSIHNHNMQFVTQGTPHRHLSQFPGNKN